MVVKCSRDSVPEKVSCSYPDGQRKLCDSIHYNDLINIDFVASFKKCNYDFQIEFAFTKYVFGNSTLYWKYETAEERDADFEKLLKLAVHQL